MVMRRRRRRIRASNIFIFIGVFLALVTGLITYVLLLPEEIAVSISDCYYGQDGWTFCNESRGDVRVRHYGEHVEIIRIEAESKQEYAGYFLRYQPPDLYVLERPR